MKIEERETWAAERVRDLFEPFGVKPFGAKKGPNETLADHVSRESYAFSCLSQVPFAEPTARRDLRPGGSFWNCRGGKKQV